MERVGISGFHAESLRVARQRFIDPSHPFLKNAEVEPRVRKLRVTRQRLPVSDFRIPLASELIQDVAEIEGNDRVDLVQTRREIVEPFSPLQVAGPLVRLRSGKGFVGIDVEIPRASARTDHPPARPCRRAPGRVPPFASRIADRLIPRSSSASAAAMILRNAAPSPERRPTARGTRRSCRRAHSRSGSGRRKARACGAAEPRALRAWRPDPRCSGDRQLLYKQGL